LIIIHGKIIANEDSANEWAPGPHGTNSFPEVWTSNARYQSMILLEKVLFFSLVTWSEHYKGIRGMQCKKSREQMTPMSNSDKVS